MEVSKVLDVMEVQMVLVFLVVLVDVETADMALLKLTGNADSKGNMGTFWETRISNMGYQKSPTVGSSYIKNGGSEGSGCYGGSNGFGVSGCSGGCG
ncbi:hypothetical protein Tco_1365801, partial [Tanacetum coccineum]